MTALININRDNPDNFNKALMALFEGEEYRVLTKNDGSLWFVAKDIFQILGIKDHKSSLRNIDEDEKGVHIIPTPGGDQEMILISESGLYAYCHNSRKPKAKRLAKIINKEVCPQIRKTGSYNSNNRLENALMDHTQAIAYIRQQNKIIENFLLGDQEQKKLITV